MKLEVSSILRAIYRVRIRFNSEESFLKRALKGRRGAVRSLMDVGCGYGRFHDVIADMGIEYHGVDLNPETIRWNSAQGRHVTSAAEVEAGGMQFDAVLASHVIEHLEPSQMVTFLNRWAGVLNDNGVFIVLTPLYHRGFYDDYDHVKPYNPDALRQVFCKSTLQIQGAGVAGKFVEEDFWLKRDPLWHSYTSKRWHHLIAAPLDVVCGITFGMVGRTTGYGIVFRKLRSG